MSDISAIRNPNGVWISTKPFREAAFHFMKYGWYNNDPVGSPDWFEFWKEERRRCVYGYEVGGARIPGDFYYYLNYCPIQRVEDTSKSRSPKVKGFPDFWDGDYNYFWVRQIARYGVVEAWMRVSSTQQEIETEEQRILELPEDEQVKERKKYLDKIGLHVSIVPENLDGGYDVIVGKSRRRGYSYKNASVASCNYLHRPGAYTMFMAYEKKYLYPKGIFNMSKNYINFANDNTAWAMPSDVVDRQDHIRASYYEYKNGLKLEKGFKSEIQAITFKDNAQAGVGKDCYDIIGEEVGAWGVPGGLKASLAAMKPSVSAGSIKSGMISLFVTSNDIEKVTLDFASMHERPLAYDFLPFNDVWGDYPEKVEGFFHPAQWNMEGHYDKEGNSDIDSAVAAENIVRENLKKNGSTSVEMQNRIREHPLNSAEAFAIISTNNFPVAELKAQLEKIKSKKLQDIKGTPVTLYHEKGDVRSKRILDGKTTPITSYKDLPLDKTGAVMVYEEPVNNAPKGLYKIGYDPVRQDSGTSLASIVVYKGVHKNSLYHSIIVAEYVGRLETAEDIDKIAEMLAEYYNTQIMHENEVTGVKNYFRRIKKLHLLAAQPDEVISKNIKKSNVARVYGCHMNDQLKDAGERYVKDWLLTILDYDENGDPIRVIDRIYSRRLLEECISYDRKGNFDLLSALFMCMFQVQEEELGTVHDDRKQNETVKQLLDMMPNMYKKNNRRGLRGM